MTELLLWVIGATLIALAVGVVFFGTQPSSYDSSERAIMPPEIANARLVMSELTVRSHGQLPLIARVDQVYQRTDGLVIPVDTKTRNRRQVRLDDQIEISVQAYVLRNGSKRYRTAGYGYVRVVLEGSAPYYLRTPLLDDVALSCLVDRYRGLQAGTQTPTAAHHPGQCRSCGQRPGCSAALA